MHRVSSSLIGLSVANLELCLDGRASGMRMALPECHAKFLQAGAADGGLVLNVREGALRPSGAWRPLYHPSETWELWQDEAGRYVFVTSQHWPPRRQVSVDAGFRWGEVLGEFGAGTNSAEGLYPLRDLDVQLFANWLAESGDLILHAAGVSVDGRGYCFAGASGAGKSTLAAAFAEASGSTVLGEDNLILRYVDGRFWIFGTPWHLNPARCNPLGAPLDKLFFPDRAACHGARPCPPLDGITRLLQTAFVPYYRPAAVARILGRLALLAERVPFFTLGYRLGSDVMELVQ